MLRECNGVWSSVVGVLLATSCSAPPADLPADLDEAFQPQPLATYAAQAGRVRSPLPGRSARTVLDEHVNEAENLFFTEDGRLFVSSAEDIFEVKRAVDGSFVKTDHFDEDCVVEGIIEREHYLYGVCSRNGDPGLSSYLVAGELSAEPVFHSIAPLDPGSGPNGMALDAQGQIYVTYSLTDQIAKVVLASPLEVERSEIWADGLLLANGIKYVDGAMYVTVMDLTLNSRFVRIPILPDGSAGTPVALYEKPLALLDDTIPFEGGFIITDFLNGTLIFWDEQRGAYAETPNNTFYGPTALAQGVPPMFDERQLIVGEKGLYTVRDEQNGDLLSMYQLP